MKKNLKQIKQILVTAMLTLTLTSSFAQRSNGPVSEKHAAGMSRQLKEFYRLTAQANVTFTFPKGFKEVKAPDNEYFSFDYALELPGKNFEIWFQVKSEKANWDSYIKSQNANSANAIQTNPDSLYVAIAAAQATELTGDKNFLIRTITQPYLEPYNADVGKSYVLNLPDLTETKHYKYALMFVIHKFHTGTIVAVCFTNEKGLEFFKNIDRVKNCLKFKS